MAGFIRPWAVWVGSFQMAQTLAPEPGEKLMVLTYYSFITLSTVAYGDVSDEARCEIAFRTIAQ